MRFRLLSFGTPALVVGGTALVGGAALGAPPAAEADAGAHAEAGAPALDLDRAMGDSEVEQDWAVRTADATADSHWAFEPIDNPTPPTINKDAWVRNAIDAFVGARLEQQGVYPSQEASPATLLRRVYLDLIGLLPSEEEVVRFAEDASDEAYEAAVDELLASPHFGERWALYWLDAARYADSEGYVHDEPRTIWPYRDYVIRAFNDDLPFDQFVIEQLAGDLLAGASPEALLASSFHRNTMTNNEGGIDQEEFRTESVKDRVNTTAKVFLGLTLECAQCHDHVYEPLTQREYYQFYAFFNDADEASLTMALPEMERDVELLTFEQRQEPRETFVQQRGDFLDPGDLVEPGVPAVLPPLQAIGRADRLDLALWMTSAEHPLLARVTVNRIWQALFGLGLVETEDDFGRRGDPPSHPELLDWLAHRFREDGWSMKSLIRQMVTSATYRQASARRPSVDDPKNRLLARQSRLRVEAEIIRDITLQAAGLLDRRVGGPSVYPPIPDGVLDTGRGEREWPESEGSSRYRRGIYTFLYRTVPYPSLVVFDAPDAVVSTTRRSRSNTFLQALTLLNDEVFFDAALQLGVSLSQLNEWDDVERLVHAFRRTLSRDPEARELEVLVALLSAERDSDVAPEVGADGSSSDGDAPKRVPEDRGAPSDGIGSELDVDSFDVAEATSWTMVARVLLNLDEFITRE